MTLLLVYLVSPTVGDTLLVTGSRFTGTLPVSAKTYIKSDTQSF